MSGTAEELRQGLPEDRKMGRKEERRRQSFLSMQQGWGLVVRRGGRHLTG